MYTSYSKIKSLASISVLNKMTLASIFFCIYDLALYFLSKFVLSDSHIVVIICDIFYLAFYAALCFSCFVFSASQLKMLKITGKKLLVSAVPAGIVIIVAVIVMIAQNSFDNIKNLLLCCGVALTVFYVVILILQSIYFALKKKIRFSAKSTAVTVIYFSFVFLSIIIQWLFFSFYLPQIFFTFFALYWFMTLQERQCLYDSLSRVMNRRGLDKLISHYLKNMPKNPVFVMMLDINNLKSINDTFGHTAGDSALTDAAQILKKAVGKFAEKPHLYRYGGDEFLIIAEDFSLDKIGELKEYIEAECKRKNKSPGCGKPYYLNFSTGVAFAKIESAGDLQRLIHIADEEMYKAKNYSKTHV